MTMQPHNPECILAYGHHSECIIEGKPSLKPLFGKYIERLELMTDLEVTKQNPLGEEVT